MGKIMRTVGREFVQRPVSNTFMAIGGILLTRSLSNYLDRLESAKRHEDMLQYYPLPLGDAVELDMEQHEALQLEYQEESARG